jgi:hypothetical protein
MLVITNYLEEGAYFEELCTDDFGGKNRLNGALNQILALHCFKKYISR